MKRFGIILILMSGIFFGLIFAVPFLPYTIGQKGIITTVLVVCGEIAWWVGVVILGKEVVAKYKKFLDPRKWF
ncbi:MAG: transporter suffix domain-containing protein [Bacteroidota bacterium]